MSTTGSAQSGDEPWQPLVVTTRAPAQAALERGSLHSHLLSWLAVVDVSWEAGPTTPVQGWEEDSLMKWRPQVQSASHHPALTSVPRLICPC